MTKRFIKLSYPGDGYYYVICDSCGKKMRAKDAKLRWDNFLVCSKDFEQRHPQDSIRVPQKRRQLNPKYVRSEGEDIFFSGGSADDL